MAYVVKPFGKADLIPAIEVARARFAEIQAVEAEVSDLTERLESRKAVDRAKSLLQSGLGLTEPEAFRWIQKTAMDFRSRCAKSPKASSSMEPARTRRDPGLGLFPGFGDLVSRSVVTTLRHEAEEPEEIRSEC